MSPSEGTAPQAQDYGADRGRQDTSRDGNRRVSQQELLGKGRPGTGNGGVEPHRPTPVQTESSPVNSLRLARHAVSPVRTESTNSTDDEDSFSFSSSLQPPTALPPSMSSGEQTPRVGGSQRGAPPAALGSSFGSPAGHFNVPSSSGGSAPRPPRTGRYNTSTAHPASHPLNFGQMGSSSRSASRARPALHSQASGGALGTFRGMSKKDEEDEEEVEDRGQALIRKRQKERKQLRKAKERERERRLAEEGGGEGGTPDVSAPPTGGYPDDSLSAQQARGPIGSLRAPPTSRSVSRTRAVSASRRIPSEGYFASGSISGTETPRDGGLSPSDERRPSSLYSSTVDEDDDENPPDNASIIEDVVQEIVAEETAEGSSDSDSDDDGLEGADGDEGVTLKDRQDAINIEHPFGLPIWKPALYRKSRSVTRNAESALHSIPSAAAERHLLPGNILWVLLFGWWLAIACSAVAVTVSGAEVLGGGRGGYGKTLRGLAWYIGWPFGKYVEGEGAPEDDSNEPADDEETEYGALNGHASPTKRNKARTASDGASSGITVRESQIRPTAPAPSDEGTSQDELSQPSSSTNTPASAAKRPESRREQTVSFASTVKGQAKASLRSLGEPDERSQLLGKKPSPGAFRRPRNKRAKMLGRLIYWPTFLLVIAPSLLFVCTLCWGFVITIPMAKLTWALFKLLAFRPLEINFRAAPKISIPIPHDSPGTSSEHESGDTTLAGSGSGSGSSPSPGGQKMQRARLHAGQVAPTSGPTSTVLLCTYRAVGLQYYKYTVGGVNIIFINLLPLVFFTIIDGLLILPAVEEAHKRGHAISPFLTLITSQALIFVLGLASVIPLSYFIGMAVASISAQSSIGMGAVINATFGSVIEIILYSIALTQGKGRLVEGSIVGSILAGVLLMPGASMCSGALKRKEQRFNAKSAGVTSTMLIMAIIGTLTPTMFYQTYGSFELHCNGCPSRNGTIIPQEAWQCDTCYYEHPDPIGDPFYQDQVKNLMYACAGILLFSYLIGLWFSLRTHAAQIWQNPQQLMKAEEHPAAQAGLHPSVRSALAQRVTPQAVMSHILPLHKDKDRVGGHPGTSLNSPVIATSQASTLRLPTGPRTAPLFAPVMEERDHSPSDRRERDSLRVSSGNYNLPAGYTPFLETVDRDMRGSQNLTPMKLPSTLTTEDFTRAVAVATVSALRHQGSIVGSHQGSASKKERLPVSTHPIKQEEKEDEEEGEGGGHEAPSWTRGVSAGVLLACTLLYAIIAEILVDVVDVVLNGSGIDEKFLGLTLFALVPNTTEFMNAVSFAMNGNIALSMEIGSAYALQVCLLQIPAMVAFSALYDPGKMGEVVDTFTLIFPRWDVIAIILSIFLLTYTYIEARSNYHRGSILVLAYIVLVMGFYFAPPRAQDDPETPTPIFTDTAIFIGEGIKAGFGATMSKLWA